MTSRLCKRRIFGVFLDAIEKKNSHKWKDIHHTLNPSSERYIKPRREHLCGKYIENHQKNYREGRYTIEIVEPSSLTPLPDLFFVAKTKIKLHSDFCACSSFIAECRYQFEVDSLKTKFHWRGIYFCAINYGNFSQRSFRALYRYFFDIYSPEILLPNINYRHL